MNFAKGQSRVIEVNFAGASSLHDSDLTTGDGTAAATTTTSVLLGA